MVGDVFGFVEELAVMPGSGFHLVYLLCIVGNYLNFDMKVFLLSDVSFILKFNLI